MHEYGICHWILSIHAELRLFSVVEVGFVQSEYTVSELNMSVIICAAVKHGSLGVLIQMSIISHSLTALGNSIHVCACMCMCMYIHVCICIYVKRKVWIQTICRFCCANPGSTLCAANPRLWFMRMRISWKKLHSVVSFVPPHWQVRTYAAETTVHIFMSPHVHFVRVHFTVRFAQAQFAVSTGWNVILGPVGGVTPNAFALHVSFLYGYCSVAYWHPRSAPTLDNCNTQRWAEIAGDRWNSSTVPHFCAAPVIFIWLW